MKHLVLNIAGEMLYPFVHGYMSAKYRKKMHVSLFQDYITLVYARADATPVVITVDEVTRMDRRTLAAWFHAKVADLNPDEVIPQLSRFRKAAQQAHELAHGGSSATAGAVPRVSIPRTE